MVLQFDITFFVHVYPFVSTNVWDVKYNVKETAFTIS